MRKISLLYLCTGNSCRSQMAEGWTRTLKSDEIEVHSAGIESHGLNPSAVQVMAEAGVDITGQRSQRIEEFEETRIDYVITLCDHAHETCPWFPADCKVIHVGFADPPTLTPADATAEVKLVGFRRVRDEIRAMVETLPEFLQR